LQCQVTFKRAELDLSPSPHPSKSFTHNELHAMAL
jgi:hypothetical protein